MSDRRVVQPPTHTRPGRVFSPGIVHNGLLWASGATGSDPGTGDIVEGGVAGQTRKALENLRLVAREAGTSLDHVLRLTVYLTDITNGLAPMNAAFAEVFPTDPPARSTIEVAGLARPGLLVEIDMVAAIDE
ncbi:MAG: RidA family protein [Actinomycetia bacterium]|nr:RidA family protein [Actinomycetes bacterium]